jgi:hypothetical protein
MNCLLEELNCLHILHHWNAKSSHWYGWTSSEAERDYKPRRK